MHALMTAARVAARKRALRYAEERTQRTDIAEIIQRAYMAGYDSAHKRQARA